MKAASPKLSLPAPVVEMPMSRAPRRLTAVARKALPRKVRSKNRNRPTMRTIEAMKMISVWPESAIAPAVKRWSQKLGLRKPSAPKNTRPRPVSAKCTPTETISSTSTVASARR